uniref:UBX domain-containing protein n=1 Tax=Psilocybe cubensis TaxID=181762 RepID=A0A8H7Y042_PSICU
MSESSSTPQAPQTSSVPASEQLPTDFKVFRPTARSPAPLAELSDDYFTPTAADLQAAQATLSARTQALVNAPLKVRAVREAEAAAKLNRWPETRIRIKFLDQTILEKSFPSTNKIRSVYAFVRGCLREDVKPIKFILYQPPKRDLKVSDPTVRDQTLASLQLAPSSVLLLRFEDDKLNHVNVPAPLAPFVLEQAVDLPSPPVNDDKGKDDKSPSSSSTPSAKPKTSGGEVKMPKWLKLGQKK